LKKLAVDPFRSIRGKVICRACLAAGLSERESIQPEGEIWIQRLNSAGFYAAPVAICHYIETHKYKPPKEFIDALKVGDRGRDKRRFADVIDDLLAGKNSP